MEPLRESLTADFLKRVEKELGREATLRFLWPQVVGPRLAGNTQLKSIRGAKLIVSVPDRSWLNSLVSLEKMILAAANRLGGERRYDSIEFVEDPQAMMSPREANGFRTAGRASREFETSARSTGNRAERETSPPAEIDTGMITDENLRRLFLESAKKYFRASAGIRTGGTPVFPAKEDRRI